VRRHWRLITATLILVLVVGTITTAFGILFLRPLPSVDGDERLLGLHERAEVLRDTFGVPHIFAANEHDAFFLQGFVTAQDRLFQMDLYRRAAAGRLAEVLGEPGLDSDRFMRTVGLARAAQLDQSVISPATLAILQAFADGVNKFLEQHGESLPVEFVILGYKPERWSPLDTLTVAKLQIYDAAGNYTQELLRAGLAERFGLDVLPALMPDPGLRAPGTSALASILGGAGEALGSNCWALAGSKTKSGKPLLAGDPHLPVRNPSIWFEVAISYGGFSLIGFSIPGVPGVVIGHNDKVAWSFTYASADTQDLFVEHQDPSDLRRFEYQNRFEAATFVREAITVKGRKDPVLVDVAITRHGPVITNVLSGQKVQLSLRWSALDATKTVEAVVGMNRARSIDDFRRAAAGSSGRWPHPACGMERPQRVARTPTRRGERVRARSTRRPRAEREQPPVHVGVAAGMVG
jgi:penicillin amidase